MHLSDHLRDEYTSCYLRNSHNYSYHSEPRSRTNILKMTKLTHYTGSLNDLVQQKCLPNLNYPTTFGLLPEIENRTLTIYLLCLT